MIDKRFLFISDPVTLREEDLIIGPLYLHYIFAKVLLHFFFILQKKSILTTGFENNISWILKTWSFWLSLQQISLITKHLNLVLAPVIIPYKNKMQPKHDNHVIKIRKNQVGCKISKIEVKRRRRKIISRYCLSWKLAITVSHR